MIHKLQYERIIFLLIKTSIYCYNDTITFAEEPSIKLFKKMENR